MVANKIISKTLKTFISLFYIIYDYEIFRHYKCSKYGRRSKNCYARLIVRYDGVREKKGPGHSHEKDPSKERLKLFSDALQTAAANEVGTLKDIYNRIQEE